MFSKECKANTKGIICTRNAVRLNLLFWLLPFFLVHVQPVFIGTWPWTGTCCEYHVIGEPKTLTFSLKAISTVFHSCPWYVYMVEIDSFYLSTDTCIISPFPYPAWNLSTMLAYPLLLCLHPRLHQHVLSSTQFAFQRLEFQHSFLQHAKCTTFLKQNPPFSVSSSKRK